MAPNSLRLVTLGNGWRPARPRSRSFPGQRPHTQYSSAIVDRMMPRQAFIFLGIIALANPVPDAVAQTIHLDCNFIQTCSQCDQQMMKKSQISRKISISFTENESKANVLGTSSGTASLARLDSLVTQEVILITGIVPGRQPAPLVPRMDRYEIDRQNGQILVSSGPYLSGKTFTDEVGRGKCVKALPAKQAF